MGTQTGHLVDVFGKTPTCCRASNQIGNYNRRAIGWLNFGKVGGSIFAFNQGFTCVSWVLCTNLSLFGQKLVKRIPFWIFGDGPAWPKFDQISSNLYKALKICWGRLGWLRKLISKIDQNSATLLAQRMSSTFGAWTSIASAGENDRK